MEKKEEEDKEEEKEKEDEEEGQTAKDLEVTGEEGEEEEEQVEVEVTVKVAVTVPASMPLQDVTETALRRAWRLAHDCGPPPARCARLCRDDTWDTPLNAPIPVQLELDLLDFR